MRKTRRHKQKARRKAEKRAAAERIAREREARMRRASWAICEVGFCTNYAHYIHESMRLCRFHADR